MPAGNGCGSFIVMEHLNFGGSFSQADLGRNLALMHKAEPAVSDAYMFCLTGCAKLEQESGQAVGADANMRPTPQLVACRCAFQHAACMLQDPMAKQGKFGFAVDNTIGGTDQPNGWMENWVDFFRERRLQHMLRLLNNSRCNQMGQKLCDNLEKLFEGCEVGSLRWACKRAACSLHGWQS